MTTLSSTLLDVAFLQHRILCKIIRSLYYVSIHQRAPRNPWRKVFIERSHVTSNFDDPDFQSRRNEFTTDGTRLYFTVGNHESDLWVVELGDDGTWAVTDRSRPR